MTATTHNARAASNFPAIANVTLSLTASHKIPPDTQDFTENARKFVQLDRVTAPEQHCDLNNGGVV